MITVDCSQDWTPSLLNALRAFYVIITAILMTSYLLTQTLHPPFVKLDFGLWNSHYIAYILTLHSYHSCLHLPLLLFCGIHVYVLKFKNIHVASFPLLSSGTFSGINSNSLIRLIYFRGCMWVYPVCAGVCIHVEKRLQRQVSFFRCCPSFCPSLLLVWSLLIRLGWLASVLRAGPTCPCLLCIVITRACSGPCNLEMYSTDWAENPALLLIVSYQNNNIYRAHLDGWTGSKRRACNMYPTVQRSKGLLLLSLACLSFKSQSEVIFLHIPVFSHFASHTTFSFYWLSFPGPSKKLSIEYNNS